MIGFSQAAQLQVEGEVPPLLRSACFLRSEGLWRKGQPAEPIPADQLSKRYEYVKRGRMLGMATTRFLAVAGDTLLYFDELNSQECLGYCLLQNVYLQWLPVAQGRFLLVISNGSEASHFFFSSAAFWEEQRSSVALSAVLLNFETEFEVLEELGEGSFARVYRVRELRSER